MERLAAIMRDVRRAIPQSLRSEGINYIYDFVDTHPTGPDS